MRYCRRFSSYELLFDFKSSKLHYSAQCHRPENPLEMLNDFTGDLTRLVGQFLFTLVAVGFGKLGSCKLLSHGETTVMRDSYAKTSTREQREERRKKLGLRDQEKSAERNPRRAGVKERTELGGKVRE